MSSYEFWDELGKIFNAVVAYQEKNIEFNKRFISPWIRLGNVFEKQDRNKEAIGAYERAIELDEANPQNWFELGNVHFKMENYAEAISAFNRAIELDPGFGLAYSNLALALATTGETERSVTLYQKGIELLEEAKDKAVAWNRLGNAYRKLNQYEQALEAFHRADELDADNAGFRDSLDEVSEGPTLVQSDGTAENAQPLTVSPIELIVTENRTAEAAANAPENGEAVPERQEVLAAAEELAIEALTTIEVPAEALEPTGAEAAVDAAPETVVEPAAAPIAEVTAETEVEPAPEVAAEPAVESPAEVAAAEISPEATAGEMIVPEATASEAAGETTAAEEAKETVLAVEATAAPQETVTVVVQDTAETFTETVPVGPAATETVEAALAPEATAEEAVEAAAQTTDVITSDDAAAVQQEVAVEAPEVTKPADAVLELEGAAPVTAAEIATEAEAPATVAEKDPAPNSLADQLLEAEPGLLDVAPQAAYEEYLKDTLDPLHDFDEEEHGETELPGGPEPMTTIDSAGDVQIEMDTKNAHVWNELGNVYFNTSAFDDAIVAYSKAIELDRWFAWPYSNLALAYVQKRRFVEAILLYQRSIELFSSDKDKAISWNRLGNVYRRLNDYENAIAAYQRADALDPDNSTLSLQSRFSLLGNYAMEQKPSYVS
jgi:tetratricopeptide (TPR) repeat protein